MSEHAILGGSVADKMLGCPGYRAAVADLPEQADNDFTVEGTALHALAEQYLSAVIDKRQVTLDNALGRKWIGNIPPKWKHKEYTDEHIALVRQSVDNALAFYEPGDEVYIEKKVVMRSVADEMFGSLDFAVVKKNRSRVIVFDHKFGGGKRVEAIDNNQGKFYAVALADELSLPPMIQVTIVISQPRFSAQPSIWEAGNDVISEWRGMFRHAYQRQIEADAPCVAGAHCRWCKKTGSCYALAEYRRLAVRREFGEGANPATLDNQTLSRLLLVKPLVEQWLESVASHALERAQAGKGPTDWKVVEGRKGHRQWVDEDQAQSVLEMALDDEAFEKKLLSPTKLEQKIGKDAFAAFGNMVEQPSGKPKLEPSSSLKSDFNKQSQARADFSV